MWTPTHGNTAAAIGLWPNPASEWLRIDWGRLPVDQVVVLDALGRRVVEQQVMGEKGVVLAMHDRPSGLYNLVLEGDGVKQSRKFAVMH